MIMNDLIQTGLGGFIGNVAVQLLEVSFAIVLGHVLWYRLSISRRTAVMEWLNRHGWHFAEVGKVDSLAMGCLSIPFWVLILLMVTEVPWLALYVFCAYVLWSYLVLIAQAVLEALLPSSLLLSGDAVTVATATAVIGGVIATATATVPLDVTQEVSDPTPTPHVTQSASATPSSDATVLPATEADPMLTETGVRATEVQSTGIPSATEDVETPTGQSPTQAPVDPTQESPEPTECTECPPTPDIGGPEVPTRTPQGL